MGLPNGDTFRELGPAPSRPTNHCAKIQIFVTIEPKPENGLRLKSQVMADKPVTVRRERIGQKIGRLGPDMAGPELLWRSSSASPPVNGRRESRTAVGGLMQNSDARPRYRAKSQRGAPERMKVRIAI